jgi:hypothetical protein
MVFVMTCQKCGKQAKSPDGRDPVTFTEFLELIREMGLRCRVCDGEIVGSAEGLVVTEEL